MGVATRELDAATAYRPLIQIAPMMEVTYKDFRQFMRVFTKRTQLWTEMFVDNTVCNAQNIDAELEFGSNEHPIVCQLGGSNPESLARAARKVAEQGYDEINLNCGCPSDRVAGKGEFGASLMKNPELVRDCVRSIADAVNLPVTVKCRLGVDDLDSPEFTANFVRVVAEGGVKHFIIHARKCILKGLTPDQNRKIPPLMYERVYLLCKEFPHLEFSLNGGINTLREARHILDAAPANLVGVMIGRAALANPCVLWDADSFIFDSPPPEAPATRRSILEAYERYLAEEHPPGSSAATSPGPGPCLGALKPIIGVFFGVPGNKILRQGIEKLCREKDVRAQGPGGVLRRCIELLAEDAKASIHLDEPLPTADAAAKALEARADTAPMDVASPQGAVVPLEVAARPAVQNE